jgi:hypothetical protein
VWLLVWRGFYAFISRGLARFHTFALSTELSDFSHIASRRCRNRLVILVAIAAAWFCTGFDGAEVSEARDGVLDEDYQTELPEFTDAEPDSPFDLFDDEKESSKSCDPEEDPNCEARQGGSGESGDGNGEGESGDGDGEARDGDGASDGDGDESSSTGDGPQEDGDGAKNFWDHEAELEPPEPPDPPDFDIPKGLLTVLQILGISILVIIVLLIVWRIALALSNRTDSAEHDDEGVPDDTGGSLRRDAPTRPHAELAAEQHHDEAIHRLLLEVIDLLSERQSGLSSPSLTSRELLRRVRLDDQTHRHLEALVRAVEEILFARRPADEQKYEACLEHYREITRALGRGNV